MFALFKKDTRQDYIDEYVKGLNYSLTNREFTPAEILEIHERTTANLVAHLERLKSDALIESKKASSNYKAASFSLTALRNSKETLEQKPNN